MRYTTPPDGAYNDKSPAGGETRRGLLAGQRNKKTGEVLHGSVHRLDLYSAGKVRFPVGKANLP